jgi:hypothetical protein
MILSKPEKALLEMLEQVDGPMPLDWIKPHYRNAIPRHSRALSLGPLKRLARVSHDFRSRRRSSRSTASRTKSVRSSPSPRTARIRSKVPSGKRACMSSAHLFVRPIDFFSYEVLTISDMRFISHIRN